MRFSQYFHEAEFRDGHRLDSTQAVADLLVPYRNSGRHVIVMPLEERQPHLGSMADRFSGGEVNPSRHGWHVRGRQGRTSPLRHNDRSTIIRAIGVEYFLRYGFGGENVDALGMGGLTAGHHPGVNNRVVKLVEIDPEQVWCAGAENGRAPWHVVQTVWEDIKSFVKSQYNVTDEELRPYDGEIIKNYRGSGKTFTKTEDWLSWDEIYSHLYDFFSSLLGIIPRKLADFIAREKLDAANHAGVVPDRITQEIYRRTMRQAGEGIDIIASCPINTSAMVQILNPRAIVREVDSVQAPAMFRGLEQDPISGGVRVPGRSGRAAENLMNKLDDNFGAILRLLEEIEQTHPRNQYASAIDDNWQEIDRLMDHTARMFTTFVDQVPHARHEVAAMTFNMQRQLGAVARRIQRLSGQRENAGRFLRQLRDLTRRDPRHRPADQQSQSPPA